MPISLCYHMKNIIGQSEHILFMHLESMHPWNTETHILHICRFSMYDALKRIKTVLLFKWLFENEGGFQIQISQ